MKERIEQLTLEQKTDLCCGKNFWETKEIPEINLPSLFMCDGPHGLRKQDLEQEGDQLGINKSRPATCFPTAVTTACSFNPKLLEHVGAAIAEEAIAQGVGLVLGPGLNLKRDPRCGRNFEYFSEDPLLSGKLAAGFIRGVESKGVGACPKHFAANNQEHQRHLSNSVMDERTLRELYLKGFEIAVKEGHPSALMSSYNQINGVYASDNTKLLRTILRDDWGFEGFVVTDWGGMHDRIAALRAGNDLLMPGGSDYMRRDVIQAVKDGSLDAKFLDEAVERLIEAFSRLSRDGKENPKADLEAHHELARRAVEESAVLLQNNGILPLKEDARLAVIGRMAEIPRYQGAGSSHINPTKLDSFRDAVPEEFYAPGYKEDGSTDTALIQEAVAKAKSAETCVVFLGLPENYESEGFDRETLDLPEGQLELLDAILNVQENVVVVLSAGGVVTVPFADKVAAILFLGLPGQASGEAVKNLLYGTVNPSGKLAETWPMSLDDVPTAENYGTRDALYKEALYVGYRYYASADVPVRYAFGHGLSYTTFELSDAKVQDDKLFVTVKNTGDRAGAEVVQLYLAMDHTAVYRPKLELKGFQKVFLEPGKSERVSFELTDDLFAVWRNGWKIEEGTYTFAVGTASDALPLRVQVEKEGETVRADRTSEKSWYRTLQGKPKTMEWERLCGMPYEAPEVHHKGEFTLDDTVEHMRHESKVMQRLYDTVVKMLQEALHDPEPEKLPEYRMMLNSSVGSPLRSLQMTGGIKSRYVRALLDLANGKFLRAIGQLFRR